MLFCLTDKIQSGQAGPACTCTPTSPPGQCHLSTVSVSRLLHLSTCSINPLTSFSHDQAFQKALTCNKKKKGFEPQKHNKKAARKLFVCRFMMKKYHFSLARQRKSYSVMMMFKYHWFRAFVKKKMNSWIKRMFYGLINKKNFLLVNLQKINVSDWKLYMTLSFIISLDQVTFHETG